MGEGAAPTPGASLTSAARELPASSGGEPRIILPRHGGMRWQAAIANAHANFGFLAAQEAHFAVVTGWCLHACGRRPGFVPRARG